MRQSKPHLLLFGALVLALFATAFAGRPRMDRPAPDFALPGLNSRDSVVLSSYRGKVVFLDFWASWCLPCRRLMPMLGDMKQRLPDLEMLAVSIDVDRNKALSFLRSVEPGLKAGHDIDQKTAETYAVEWMPTSFLIDKQGRLRFRHDSYSAEDLKKIEREANLLLSEPR